MTNEENILSVNDPLPGEENNEWEDDPDVLDFLERADEQGPWDEQYDKSYTIGGLTIAFQDADTDNAGYVTDSEDNTRTLSLKTAF